MSAKQFSHQSVLLEESIQQLAIQADGIYVDATFGRGGHSEAILAQLNESGRLYAFDRDPSAIEAAERFADDPRFHIFHHAFGDMAAVLEEQCLLGKVNGVLMDIGVSSPQLDDASRGFSFQQDGPRDMRMDTSKGISAAEWLNTASLEQITEVIKGFGEEKFGKRIAHAVLEYRAQKPLSRTLEFARLLSDAMPVKDKHKHPATRTFQGVRIFINKELEQLEHGLEGAVKSLAPLGRLAVISFHSLEDRCVKRFMRKHSQGLQMPSRLPLTEDVINQSKILNLVGRAIKPSANELTLNPRARSSVLRVAEKR